MRRLRIRKEASRLQLTLAALLLYLIAPATHLFAADTLLNRPAPPFSRTDIAGARISLSQYRGKVVLLNFWATWCAPCRVELPRFFAWQKQYAGLQIIAVSMDDDPAPVHAFLRELKPNYPVLMGDAKLGERYGGVLGLPVTFLIDRRGIVRARIEGETSLDALQAQIRRLLATR